MKTITEEQYHEYADSFQGFCLNCQDFTRDCTEGDAEEYDCPICGENTVMGTEQALMLGEIGLK